MLEDFSGYYRPNRRTLEAIWRECFFALDANVLLGLYRYPKEAHDALLRTFGQISDRLWIPHQVALEYQENRLSVIAEQLNKYDEVCKILDEAKESLIKKIDNLQLKKRHSVIDPEKFLARVRQTFDEFESELEALKQDQPDISDDDRIRDEIDALLNVRVGKPLTPGELQKLYAEGKNRYEQKRPPGYLDKGKANQDEEYYFAGDQIIRREYGDLILWFQVIKEAKIRSSKYVVFVTDDDKDDWWWNFKGKTIGPRPELVAEIIQQAGVAAFYMYSSARFLDYAKDFLGAQIKPETIAQVREISRFQKEPEKTQTPTNEVEQLPPLTSRETEILTWVTRGYSNEEIAHELGISRQTVKNHMTAILSKMNFEKRTQAAVYALQHGLVQLKDSDEEET